MKILDKPTPYCIVFNIDSCFFSLYYKEEKNIIVEFLNTIIKNSEKNITFFSHNINFDGYIILDSLIKFKIKFEWYIRDLNLYWIKVYYAELVIEIRCSYKLIPLSVESLGKMLGQSKKIFPHKFSSISNLLYAGPVPDQKYFNSAEEYNSFLKENSLFDFKTKSLEYCKNDVEIVNIVLKNILNICSQYSKSFFWRSYSFSSLSYKIFSKKYDTFGVTKKKLQVQTYDYIVDSYFGGNTQVFGNPKEGMITHAFDYSGMYGQSMLEKFPYDEGSFKIENLDWSKPGFHTIKVKSDMLYPILPIKHKGKLFFPNGIFTGRWNHVEIIRFVEVGGVVLEHYSSYQYSTEDYVFKDFVTEFTEIRKKGIYYKIFGKSIVNGGYGSFALNEEDYLTTIVFNKEEFEIIKEITDVISYKNYGECYILKIKKNSLSKKIYDKEGKWNTNLKERNIAYASMIAAKARVRLHKALINVVNDGGELYYTDTDSIFAGYSTNRLGQSVGDVKWSEVYEDAVFISPKFYCLKGSKPKIKGISHTKMGFEEIKAKFYSNEEFIEFNDQLRFKKNEYSIFQDYTKKTLKINYYDKRSFSPDKKTTTPVTINTD